MEDQTYTTLDETPEAIRAKIRHVQGLLDDAREDKRKAQATLHDLDEHVAAHQRLYSQIDQELTDRRQRIAGTAIDPARVQVLSAVKQKLSDLVDQGEVQLTKMASEARSLDSMQTKLQDQVDQHGTTVQKHEDDLEELKLKLRKAEQQEVSHV